MKHVIKATALGTIIVAIATACTPSTNGTWGTVPTPAATSAKTAPAAQPLPSARLPYVSMSQVKNLIGNNVPRRMSVQLVGGEQCDISYGGKFSREFSEGDKTVAMYLPNIFEAGRTACPTGALVRMPTAQLDDMAAQTVAIDAGLTQQIAELQTLGKFQEGPQQTPLSVFKQALSVRTVNSDHFWLQCTIDPNRGQVFELGSTGAATIFQYRTNQYMQGQECPDRTEFLDGDQHLTDWPFLG